MKTNYQAFSDRIARSQSHDDVLKCSKSLERLYKIGILTETEYTKLDFELLDKIEELGND